MRAIEAPRLDDRGYEDLRRELLQRIPVHSAAWTDHNPSDPGITLLELFAWLGSNLLYRMNRVPDKALVQFLNLLGVPLQPATPARALIRFSVEQGTLDPQPLEYAPTVPRTLVASGAVQFQVTDEVEVLPVEGLPMIKRQFSETEERQLEDEQRKLTGFEEMQERLAQDAGNREATGEPRLVKYRTFLLPPAAGQALPPATPLFLAPDGALWIALLTPARLPAGAAVAVAREEVKEGIARRTLSVGIQVDDELCGPDDHLHCPDPETHPTAQPLVWQIATGRWIDGAPPGHPSDLRYDRLAVRKDGTQGLTRSGVVQLELPDVASFGTWRRDQLVDDMLMGVGDMPPLLPEAELEERVITWIRCFRPSADDPSPRVRWAGINAVLVEQAVTAAPETLGRGSGVVGQEFRLSNVPVLPDDLYVEVQEAGNWVRFERRETFADSQGDDPHFVLEPETGIVRFGDGVQGRRLRVGEPVRARSYRFGGGMRGNVAAGTITQVVRKPHSQVQVEVTNDLPAMGGKDGETAEAGRARLPKVLRHRDRAVGAADFCDLALETPGVHVGRAHVLPRHKPHERMDEIPGVVTLIVLPAYDPLHPDEPVPDREMLRRVCAYLEPRRLVTTELYVTPPEYVPIWASVAVEVEPGYGIDTVGRWVDLAIRQYFAPLPPYGPQGDGWPFNRDVRLNDVEAAALRVEGVRVVHDVRLRGTERPPNASPQVVHAASNEENRRVLLRAWQLPAVRTVQVTTETDAETISIDGDGLRPPGFPPPTGDDNGGTEPPVVTITLPVEVEKC